MLPTAVIETEDKPNIETQGGERVPPKLDPWENQIYLREWKYFGWQLRSGDSIRVQPILYQFPLLSKARKENTRSIHIYARATFDKARPKDFPILEIIVNGTLVGEISISSEEWDSYNIKISFEERRPFITLTHQKDPDSQASIIIDKVRFY